MKIYVVVSEHAKRMNRSTGAPGLKVEFKKDKTPPLLHPQHYHHHHPHLTQTIKKTIRRGVQILVETN